MFHSGKLLIFILVFMCLWKGHLMSFNVKFREKSDIKIEQTHTQISKRDMAQFFDKASYSFDGLDKIQSVPVHFPIDICVMNVEGVKYTVALHIGKNSVRHFVAFKTNKGNYVLVADIPAPIAIAMDCKSLGPKGYVALAYNITEPIQNAKAGSPLFEIAGDRLRPVQYFAATNLYSVYLQVSGNDFFLLQTFQSTQVTPNLRCPYFLWSGSTFNNVGFVPCSNARHLEPFSIEYESYVAVANYADQFGNTATDSEIYKFVREKKQFQLFQKIKTNGAVDARHFSVPLDETRRQHFLIFGNSISTAPIKSSSAGKELEADSIFFLFDKGLFVPYQRLTFYAVQQFLPVQNADAEKFLLLVTCTNQDVRIYNLNDWMFEESKTQFTEGAFGRGVANMRVYQETDNSYLVIANALMSENDTNIFRPIFKQDVHANALRQQIIDWTKTETKRLTSIDVEKLKEQVQSKLAQQPKPKFAVNITNIKNANIQVVTTKTLLYPRLHMSNNYWKALSYANQALDALQSQFVTKQRSKREMLNESVALDIRNASEYQFRDVKVGTLSVRSNINAQKLNGIKVAQPQFERIAAKEVIVTGTYKAPAVIAESTAIFDGTVHVKNLFITGKFNDYTWSHLMRNTLQRTGQQFLKAPVVVNDLRANAVMVTNNEVHGHNLAKLVSITGGSYVVQQDLKFDAPISAKEVIINERLNNIYVNQQKLDVLLKKSNESQVIEGDKRFDSIRVLEPITIAGTMLGNQFRSITPNKAIHKDIILHGDYIISGDVTIAKLLNTRDIITKNANTSVKNTLANALRLDKTFEDVNIKFIQPIEVNNSMVSFINTQDLQHLLKINVDDVQVVEGEKIFNSNLEMRKGISEVKFLNGHEVEALEKRFFLKNTNQTIHIPMHFGKILAKRVITTNLTLAGKNITEYITKSGTQVIRGVLKVETLTTQTLELENLNTNGNIFNAPISAIYQQKSKSAPMADIFQKSDKFHGSIFVENLLTNSTVNGQTVTEIERQLALLHGNIKYVGNFQFNYDMNVTQLTFNGKLNGISVEDFGQCWLQKEGSQNFLVPQTLGEINCAGGVLLQGKLNNHQLDAFFTDALWVNRNEYIKDAVFQNPIQMQSALRAHTIKNVYVPQDILYRSTHQTQFIYGHTFVQNNVLVRGNILNTSTINGINLESFDRYLNGFDMETIYIENACFATVPSYRTLNHYNLQHTLNAVWLKNEDVNLKNEIEISEGFFTGLIEFAGSINNVNLRYLKDNYLSLSKSQRIESAIIFTNQIQFKNDLSVENMRLIGSLFDSKSSTQFDFDGFVSYTLKTSGPHEISGQWSFNEATVEGDLHAVKVNNLNLAKDVLRVDMQLTEITAPKSIPAAFIEKLYVTPKGTVNNVAIDDWIQNTVHKYGNYTIHGVTTVNTIHLYNDLQVLGHVNNFTFNDHTLLLRSREDQVLHGTLRIRNTLPEEKRILVNNFDNLQSQRINGTNVAELFYNQAKLIGTPPVAAQIIGHLVFTQPLRVEQYHNRDGEYNAKKWKRDIGNDNETFAKWNKLENVVENFKKSFEAPYHILDYFEIRQTLHIQAEQIIPLTLRIGSDLFDIIGILKQSGSNEIMEFYCWNTDLQKFILDEAFSWLPKDKTLINLMKLFFVGADYLRIDKPQKDYLYENVITNETYGLQKVMQLRESHNSKIATFEMRGEHCLAVYGNKTLKVSIFCLKLVRKPEKLLKIYEKPQLEQVNVKQIVALTNTTLALLHDDAVEIWQTDADLHKIQHIPIVAAKRMAAAMRNGSIYLALLSDMKPNTLHHGTIEIYSASPKTSFTHLQTLDCVAPKQIEFSVLKRSDDLLLHILTSTADQPLIIYQHRGVAGFIQIVSTSILPRAENVQTISLEAANQNLVALMGKEEITFVEIVLKQF